MQSQILSHIAELETKYAEALGQDAKPEELNKIYTRIKKLQELLNSFNENQISSGKEKRPD